MLKTSGLRLTEVMTEKWTARVESPAVPMVDRTVEEQPQCYCWCEEFYLKSSHPGWTLMLVEEISQICSVCLLNSMELTVAGGRSTDGWPLNMMGSKL